MKEAIKKEWVAALRSGKYKQGRGKLRHQNDTFCCLGVLIDVMGEEWYVVAGNYRCDGLTTSLSDRLLDVTELTSESTLMKMNDDKRKSFDEIADWIDENL